MWEGAGMWGGFGVGLENDTEPEAEEQDFEILKKLPPRLNSVVKVISLVTSTSYAYFKQLPSTRGA